MAIGYQRPDPRGRKPTRTIRYTSVGPGRARLRFSLGYTVVDELLRLAGTRLRLDNYRDLRLQFRRWPREAPNLVLFQFPSVMPSFDLPDPTGMLLPPVETPPWLEARLTQLPYSPRFVVEVKASLFDIRPGATGQSLPIYVHHAQRGLMVQFPIEALTDDAARQQRMLDSYHKRNEPAHG